MSTPRRHPLRNPWVQLAAVLGILGLVVVLVLDRVDGFRPADPPPNQQAEQVEPGWTAIDASFEPAREILERLEPLNDAGAFPREGKVLVNVWASWCGPCRDELPWMKRLDKETDVAVVGVSRDFVARNSTKMMKEFGITYPNWFDPSGEFGEALHGIIPPVGLPISILVEDGRATGVQIGEFDSYASLLRATTAAGFRALRDGCCATSSGTNGR